MALDRAGRPLGARRARNCRPAPLRQCPAGPADRFASLWPLGATVLGEATAAPRAGALAALAQRAWARGDTVDVALALPRYVRDKVAQTTAERRAIAQAPRHIDRLMTEADIPAVLAMEQAACVPPRACLDRRQLPIFAALGLLDAGAL